MARALSEKVGRGPCPECGETVTFRRSSGGMLTHKCDSCDSSGYAEPGGQAYKKRMAKMTMHQAAPDDQSTPKEAPKNEPKEPTPAPKKRNSVFSLGDL